jgi:hypothetical protein
MSRVQRASVNEWGRATEVWARFQETYPGYKGGVWVDPIEGPVWVIRAGTVVEVTHDGWGGRFHIREAHPEQQSLELPA